MDDLTIFCAILSFIVGFCACIVWQWQVKRTALSITRTNANAAGRKAQIGQDADLKALLVEASAAFQQAKEQNEDIKITAARVVPGLISKYPDVVAKHGKKLYKMFRDGGGFEALEEFL